MNTHLIFSVPSSKGFPNSLPPQVYFTQLWTSDSNQLLKSYLCAGKFTYFILLNPLHLNEGSER